MHAELTTFAEWSTSCTNAAKGQIDMLDCRIKHYAALSISHLILMPGETELLTALLHHIIQ